MKKFLSILFAVLVIGACATTDASAKTRRSNGGAKVNATPEAVKNAYIKQLEYLKKIAKESTSKYEYFLFDISGDNVPEMFVQVGTCDMDYEMHVYTFGGGKAKKISGTKGLNPWACGFKEGNGILLNPWYKNYYQKVTLSNNRIKTTTFKGSIENYDYVDTYSIDNYSPLEEIEF